MCRWLAYSGSSVSLGDLLYRPKHSLIDQSLHSQLGAETTNGDGFGIGWYGAEHIRSPLVFAHIRAAIGSAVQETNCHPFRYGRWLFMHNGFIDGFREVKRDLVLAVDPSLYPLIEGSSDTEVFFYLALTFGLENDPPSAVAAAVGLIEAVGRTHGVEHPIQMTVATTNGTSIWAFRYSSEGSSRSLFYSSNVPTVRELYPEIEILADLSDESRLIVSEPLRDLPGAWHEVPESSYGVVQPGQDELREFKPKAPSKSTLVPA
jgi:predicted glutamine amidotransferase